MDDTSERFMAPRRIYDRATALGSPSPIPAVGGVYGWWFREPPTPLDTSRCVKRDGLTLLYVGISPKAPSANGREASRQTLRARIRTHYTGNAEGSTLRRTWAACLPTGSGSSSGVSARAVV
jgi:hypothetical protein